MPKDLLKEKSGSEPYKKKREIFTTSKIDFYIAMKGWQLNLHILENSLVNCFPTLDERLGVIEILKKIQNDQNNQIVSIKEKLPMNRKHPAFKRVNEWLEKYYKGVNTGISMEIKNLKDLEVKFVKKSIEEVEEEEEEEENIEL